MNVPRLLFIQDNLPVQSFYREKLETAGFAVRAVSSLQEGLRHLGQTQTDVVVLDPLLPDGDAAESIRAIRAEDGWHSLPICVLPTPQRALQEEISLQSHTLLVQAGDNAPLRLVEAALRSTEGTLEATSNVRGSFRPDERLRSSIIDSAPQGVAAIRHSLHALVRESKDLTILRTLLQDVHRFADQWALLGPVAVTQLAAALELLVHGLVQYPTRLDQSSLRTVSQAVDFLGAALESKDPARKADVGAAHVMVVEDEASARELIIAAMGLVGLEADGLDTPATSLAVLSTHRCDLIFLDINLPEMNGFELCTKLRAMPMHAHTPIVFLTGMNSFQNRVQSNLSGGNDFVGKPFNVAELGVKALIWIFSRQLGFS